ncbi:glycosyltransferase family 9 protein [Catenovulum sp. 2E275]|uniref:glycosyltransferase family 9 protein n=1 Tax=Catenovulum sp. 2E275 TaxID=2980497 RepID=UPI0021D35043|nr:glycosyltransferase family 9 protein [Catenovulum sp. 2E275]MCU4674223.1 glycosyltransferase family 9 protein [Catenovulum sp. 2E275]
MTSSQSIQSICILRLSAIGDVCHAVASVQAIQAHYPNAKITWVIGKIEAMLLKDLPGVRFVIFDKKQGWSAYQQLKRDLPEKFDVLLHMQVALRANIAAFFIKAKRKIGFAPHLSKELHSLVINEHAPALAQPHVLDGFKAFTAAIGVPDFNPSWFIPVSDDDKKWAEAQCNTQQPVLVIAPAASKAERNWLADRYAKLADYAVDKGFWVILSGGPTAMEKSLAQDIMAASQTSSSDLIKNCVGQSSLKQLLALLARADLVIAPDTGPAHMAVTQGTPVIGLYAHSNPARTGPYCYQNYVVEVYHQHLTDQFGQSADKLKWGTRVKGENLMADISLEAVIKMFDKVVAEQGIKSE